MVIYVRGISNLGNWIFYKMQLAYLNFAVEGDISLLHWTINKFALCSGMTYYIIQGVYSVNMLENLVKTKTISASAYKKCKGPIENCFSTILRSSVTLFLLNIQFYILFILQKLSHFCPVSLSRKPPTFPVVNYKLLKWTGPNEASLCVSGTV